METVFTFDVFDTLITRIVLDPKDVFDLVGISLSNSPKYRLETINKKFRPVRVWSEFLARRKSSQQDIDINKIYHELGLLCFLEGTQTDFLKDLELSFERKVLVPVEGAMELVASARRMGPVVFVSDMYLPSCFISEILDSFGLRLGCEPVYVSGEIGLTKGSGFLFKKIFKDFNVNPVQVVHCGDHPHSDFCVPLKIGMRVQSENRGGVGCSRYSRWLYARELLKARCQLGWTPHV